LPLEWDDEVKAFSVTYHQLNYQLESIADPRESWRDFPQSQFGRAKISKAKFSGVPSTEKWNSLKVPQLLLAQNE
jgi:hypothetical protein